ncbi:hypothetical protein [Acinetobacter junii]|uniref:hypothetical protein n=1 Tax=Acinetobacter junii TaxID=40215 RepID=UPI00125097BB|nr:hypothetical protein [Acinetobacter junii]
MRSFDEWFDENCDGSDLAKDACRKLWDEFSDQINIICRKSYEKQQSKVDDLQKRVDDLTELNRLKTIALQQSVNRTSPYVHEKIVALEQALMGGGE